MFTRVAIVNRGEAAMRFIRAAREISIEEGSPLTTIAMHTQAERHAMFVREADEAVLISSEGKDPYLDHAVLERALLESAAEAVWVGWGFVSEDPDFADLVVKLGLVFIGPTGDMMRRLGDKIGAKRLAEEAGVPVARWSGGPVTSLAQAHRHAEAIGYPLMLKATAGGGGRGIRRVNDADGLAAAFESARREALASFGNDTLLMEQMITGGRHVEVQIVADGQGGVLAAGIRDCTIQRRHQKVIEESASTALDAGGAERAKAAAAALARISGYHGVASVEFLYQPESDRLVFLEVNTRLQVEHAVTEVTTGLDLVKLQIYLARGGRLTGDSPAPRGHAIEVRLNAEDPQRDFTPAPGTVDYLVWASGPGVRIETGLAQGDVIPADFDSMIAKIIGFGRDRAEARARVIRALAETTVVIAGGMTNKAFLARLLEHPDVIAGRFDTTWLDRLMNDHEDLPAERRAVAIASAAIDAYDRIRQAGRERFFLAAIRGRPQTDLGIGYRADLRADGQAYQVDVGQIGPSRYRLVADGSRFEVTAQARGPFERQISAGGWSPGGWSHRVVSVRHGTETLVEVDGLPHRVSADDGGLVRAPSNGVLVQISAGPGDEVAAGDRLATLESMKMEIALLAPTGGWVREVLAAVGAPLDAGSPLFLIETKPPDEAATGAASRADFAALVTTEPDLALAGVTAALGEMRSQVLGYDYGAADVRRAAAGYRRYQAGLCMPAGDARVLRLELDVLSAFIDVVVLSRNRRSGEDEGSEAVHSPGEFFHAFLATMDVARAGLPASFVTRLTNAVAGYGVTGLDPGPALDDALLWMFLAQRRNATLLPAVLAILETHLDHLVVPAGLAEELRQVLDRLILATQLRHPVVGSLARSVRFRVFDGPAIQASHDRLLAGMRTQLSALATTSDPAERAASMAALVASPQPLIQLMASLTDADDAARRELIEVQTRRYYQFRHLTQVRCADVDGRRVVTGQFSYDEQEVRIVAADAAGAAQSESSTRSGASPPILASQPRLSLTSI